MQTIIMITSNSIGTENKTLGKKLMENFLFTLKEDNYLWKIILVNKGVKLAIKDSLSLNNLLLLEKKGVDVLVCGTCLKYFGLKDKKRVGNTTNMLDIVTSMQIASKVITF